MISLRGTGLHSGRAVRVTITKEAGPVRLRIGGAAVEIPGAIAVRSDRATMLGVGESRVGTVEHLFAALAAHRAHEGLSIEIEGGELPLLDGGAARFFDALGELAIEPSEPRMTVCADGVVEVGVSRYTFRSGDARSAAVTVDFGDARLARDAEWTGDEADFRARIAPARTFGFAREVEELAARGLASHVDPRSVVVIAEHEVLASGAPFTADEPARHKLLDLIGDLYLYGGPPRGAIHAFRPGHAATHAAIDEARARGLIELT